MKSLVHSMTVMYVNGLTQGGVENSSSSSSSSQSSQGYHDGNKSSSNVGYQSPS